MTSREAKKLEVDRLQYNLLRYTYRILRVAMYKPQSKEKENQKFLLGIQLIFMARITATQLDIVIQQPIQS